MNNPKTRNFHLGSRFLINPLAHQCADEIERMWGGKKHEHAQALLVPAYGYVNPHYYMGRFREVSEECTAQEGVADLRRRELRPARLYELFAFDTCHPFSRFKFDRRILALGSASGRGTPYIEDSASWRNRLWMPANSVLSTDDLILIVDRDYELRPT